MSIIERPVWMLCETLTCLNPQNSQAMKRLKDVINQSDKNYLERVREYYKQCPIRPPFEEDRYFSIHLATHRLRAMLLRVLIQHQQMKPIFMTISGEKYKMFKLADWPEITWDLAKKPDEN